MLNFRTTVLSTLFGLNNKALLPSLACPKITFVAIFIAAKVIQGKASDGSNALLFKPNKVDKTMVRKFNIDDSLYYKSKQKNHGVQCVGAVVGRIPWKTTITLPREFHLFPHCEGEGGAR